MKVVYINDEKTSITVKIQGVAFFDALDNGESLDKYFHVLRPAECKVFDLDMPANSSPYIKKWPGMVMISYIDDQVLSNLENALAGGEIMGA